MAEDERELLGRELAKLTGPKAGSLAGKVDGVSKLFVTKGTSAGARIGSRFTKVDRADAEHQLRASPDAVLRAAVEALGELGELRESDGDASRVSGVVPSGFMSLNPALVTVAVSPAVAGSRIRVDAAALEGLIGQRTAPKAVARVVGRILGKLPVEDY